MALVYSTDHGRVCPNCRCALTACICKAAAAAAKAPAGDGIVRVSRETGGRGGKVVTLVRGLPLAADEIGALGKRLRSACGTGGTTKDGVIELQGEHRDRVLALLVAEGYTAKRVGA